MMTFTNSHMVNKNMSICSFAVRSMCWYVICFLQLLHLNEDNDVHKVDVMDHLILKERGGTVIHQEQQTHMPNEKVIPVSEDGGEFLRESRYNKRERERERWERRIMRPRKR